MVVGREEVELEPEVEVVPVRLLEPQGRCGTGQHVVQGLMFSEPWIAAGEGACSWLPLV